MNEKITLQDLVNLLCEKQGINPKDAELFVRSMFELIEEALAKDKYVKIKGLGTFKLTEVESRESVHINTGERIEIQGHTKISFTPDTTMKDLINKPFAHFEPVVLNDGVELEETPVENATDEAPIIEAPQPEPIVEIPAPTEEPVEEPVAEESIAEESVVEEQPTEKTITEEVIAIEEPIVEEPIWEEPALQESAEEEVPTIETEKPAEEIPTVEPQPEIIETKEEVTEKPESIEENPSEEKVMETIVEAKVVEESKEKSINRILWGIIVVLVLIILFGAYWMFFRSEDTPEVTPAPPAQEEQVSTPAPITDEKPQEETPKTVQFIELSEEELRKERVPSFADTLDYQIVGTQEEYTLQKGETIIRASVRFFGTKKYWPYIVKHNMDVLPDPDNIPAGIRIKIPKLVEKNK